MVLLNIGECVSYGHCYLLSKLIINITPNTTKSPTMRLTRSQLAAIDQELLEFCLFEVPKFQYNFETLEAHVLTSALEK